MSGLIVAFSGGKDSTALALRLAELGEDFLLMMTPTGNELPELFVHVIHIAKLTGKALRIPQGPYMEELIESQKMLPSWHSRWCTRMVKIVPCIAYLKQNPGSTLAIGLRADEDSRVGLYGEFASYRYPLREWGWNLKEVQGYIEEKKITVPKRTDCALCPYQRTGEWYRLWKYNPTEYQKGIEYEKLTGHTFRSPSQYVRKNGFSWAVSLYDLAIQFQNGDKPSTLDENDEEKKACRVCSL